MRIAIVNDMVMVVEILRRIVTADQRYTIAWVAYNGQEAVKKCALDLPDVILMDLLMPIMDGSEATGQIMKNTPCPILIVTSSLAGNVSKVFEAMGLGALDVVKTPALDTMNFSKSAGDLLRKIENLGRLTGKIVSAEVPQTQISDELKYLPLIAIGASTGGPKAVAKILSDFPRDLNAAVVVIQHIDEKFSDALAEWLGKQTSLPVEVIKDGKYPSKGKVFLAGTNNHVVIHKKLCFEYTPNPIELVYRPSVDIFFNSLAMYWPTSSVAVLLTGMGKDGAVGLKALKKKGWYTIAEHPSTCVSYSMPKAAIDIGAEVDIFPLPDIAPEILKYFAKSVRGSN